MIYYLPPDPWTAKRYRDHLLGQIAGQDKDSILTRLAMAHEKKIHHHLDNVIKTGNNDTKPFKDPDQPYGAGALT